MSRVRVERAIVSVSQKMGLQAFAQGLQQNGVELYASGGTRRHLGEAGLPVREIAEYTGQPEMLGGRIKTLHPRIHGGILARRELPEDMEALAAHGIVPFDLVVCNLYPFEQTVARPDVGSAEAIEQIDIGGPSLIRAAAKNFASVVVVTDPQQYARVLDEIAIQGGVSRELRQELAAAAFALTAHYDQAIARYFERLGPAPEEFPRQLVLPFTLREMLRYGENPHQRAAFYTEAGARGASIATAQQIHGKELSFNNILDLASALGLVREFEEPAAAVIKHNNPCGAALGETLAEAFERAYAGDPVSAFGCVVGLNRPLDRATAETMAQPQRFIEAIVAPDFASDALDILTAKPTWKKSVRLLRTGELDGGERQPAGFDLRRIDGGLLVQSWDAGREPTDAWEVVSRRQPSPAELRDLRFGWMVVKHVKSNAVVLARERALVGVGAGQMSRVDPIWIAARKASERSRGAVLCSEAFFPFRDDVDEAAHAGVTAIIQPGGSRRDAEVLAACDEHGMAMILTGRRHFRH